MRQGGARWSSFFLSWWKRVSAYRLFTFSLHAVPRQQCSKLTVPLPENFTGSVQPFPVFRLWSLGLVSLLRTEALDRGCNRMWELDLQMSHRDTQRCSRPITIQKNDGHVSGFSLTVLVVSCQARETGCGEWKGWFCCLWLRWLIAAVSLMSAPKLQSFNSDPYGVADTLRILFVAPDRANKQMSSPPQMCDSRFKTNYCRSSVCLLIFLVETVLFALAVLLPLSLTEEVGRIMLNSKD